MTTESPPRVLTCAYNNRRRNRIHPVTHPNIIVKNETEMNVQAFKLNKPILSSKMRKNPVNKLSENSGVENVGDWSSLSKGSTHEKETKILQPQESTFSLEAEELSDVRPSIFRQMGDYDDRDGMMVLKRANPVFDSDDEDDSTPSKRRRTLDGNNTTLTLGQPLEETSDSLMFWLRK